MTGRELEKLFAEQGLRSRIDCDQIGRELRKLDMLPVGGRGPNAPVLSATHVANFVIAAVGSRTGSGVERAVKELGSLRPLGFHLEERFGEGETFGDHLRNMIAGEAPVIEGVSSVSCCHNKPWVNIAYLWNGDFRELDYIPSDMEFDPSRPDLGIGTLGFLGRLGGGSLRFISHEFNAST